MEIQTNSRFITYPSKVEKSASHTVVLIDATEDEIETLGMFLATSNNNYDVYLYRGDLHDLEWLNYIGQHSDQYLIKDDSQVKVTPDSVRYGVDRDYVNPIDYFQKIEQQPV